MAIMTSSKTVKSTIETISLLAILITFALAMSGVLKQPFTKLVLVVIFLLIWSACLSYGYKFKLSFFFNKSIDDCKICYLAEQSVYCLLIILTMSVLLSTPILT